jgi:acetylornithine deacetylase
MAEAIVAINSRDWGSNPGLGATTVNIGVVRGGETPNVIAASAECELIFRIAGDPAPIREALLDIVGRHHGHFVRDHGNPPVVMSVPEGSEAVPAAFNTDVAHLSRFGTPILFGPGSILDAHRSDEKIRKSEIISAVETYRDLGDGLLDGRTRLQRLDATW